MAPSRKSIVQSGNFKAGDRLQPTTTATTVRVRDGKTLTTDGPFAETREQLGGYYLVEAKDLDAALAIAAKHSRREIRFDRGQADLGVQLMPSSFRDAPLGRRPGIHTPDRGYRFRVRPSDAPE